MRNTILLLLASVVLCVAGFKLHKQTQNHPRIASMRAQLFESLKVRQWGVFDNAEVNLTGKPVFAVITGETGAGKSVLINALEYLCKGSTKRSLFRPGKETSVAAQIGSGMSTRRSYNAVSRRSFAEINGQKATVKSLTDQLAKTVRFWSADEGNLRDSSDGAGGGEGEAAGFFGYVDAFLGAEGSTLLEQVRAAHVDWTRAYADLQRLQSLERRMIQGNEAELLSHFLSELDALEAKLARLLGELSDTVLDLSSGEDEEEQEKERGAREQKDEEDHSKSGLQGDDGTDDVSDDDEDEEEDGPLLLSPQPQSESPLQELRSLLSSSGGGVLPSKKRIPSAAAADLDLKQTWKVLLLADRVLSALTRAMAAAFPVPSSSSSSLAAAAGAGADARQLEGLARAVQEYEDRLLSLQSGFKGVGMRGSVLDGVLERAHVQLQAASRALRGAKGELQEVQRSLPDVQTAASRLTALRAEWEALARKHGGVPASELQRLKKEWRSDLGSLSTVRADLPLAKEAEDCARAEYLAAARALSLRRVSGARVLVDKVNAALPSLEMPDKELRVLIRSREAAVVGGGDPTAPRGATARGWDEVLVSVVQRQSHFSSSSAEELGQQQEQQQGQQDARVSTLSSGETARLSLALETCCLEGSASGSEGAGAGAGEGSRLVVYDEIDAHIGGDAAVAVARLLRAQGRKWQVVAITHNPVIAAAADLHFTVLRSSAAGAGAGAAAGAGDKRSVVVEVRGREREAELARMATGRLDAAAGADLARALLGAFAAGAE